MKEWVMRPMETANLLNPAFIGQLIEEFVKSYQKEKGTGVPYELTFLALPLTIFNVYRVRLPARTSTKMQVWLQDNPELKINFASNVKEIVPFIKEAMMFLLKRNIITINNCGQVFYGLTNTRRKKINHTKESEECLKKIKLIGKWFALSGSSTTIFSMWGIRP